MDVELRNLQRRALTGDAEAALRFVAALNRQEKVVSWKKDEILPEELDRYITDLDDENGKRITNRPSIWIVTGSFCHPGIINAILIRYPVGHGSTNLPEMVCIWGYQYSSERFGSYGMDLRGFITIPGNDPIKYFKTQEGAFEYLWDHVAHPKNPESALAEFSVDHVHEVYRMLDRPT